MTGMLLSTCCCASGCSGYQLSLCSDCNTRDDWPARSKCPDCDASTACDYTWAFIPTFFRNYLVTDVSQDCDDIWYWNMWGKCWYVTRAYLEDEDNEESWTGSRNCFHMMFPDYGTEFNTCCECCMCCSSCWKTYDSTGTGFSTCTETWDNAAKPNGGMRITVTAQAVIKKVGCRYSTSVGFPDICDLTCTECTSLCQPPTCDPDECNYTGTGCLCRLRGGRCTSGNTTQFHHPCGPGVVQDDECGSVLSDTECRCSCDGTNRNCTSSSGDCDDCYVPSLGLCPSLTAPDDNLDCVLPVAQGLSAPGGGSRASGSRSTVYRPKHYEITNQLLARSNTTCVQYTDGALDGQQWVSWNAESVDVSQHSTSSAESCPAPNSTDLSNCNYDIPSCGYVCGSTSADYSRDCLSCYPDTCVNNYSRDIGVTWKSSVTALGGAAGYTIEMSGIEMGLDGSWGLMGTYNVVATSPCDSATLNFDVTLENTVDNSTRRINEFYGEATSERLKVTVTLTPNTTEDTGPSGTHINGCHHNGTCLCDSSG